MSKRNIFYSALIVVVGLLAWFKVLNFWFFKAYEATWLMGLIPHNLLNLIRGHGFLYYLDLKLFGWNPVGWYLTSLILHLAAALLFFQLMLILSKDILFAAMGGLFFVANTCYNDVLTWGSFNSYYPLLLLFFLLTLLFFYQFKATNKKAFLLLSLTTAFLGFFVRQTGIAIVPLITFFDLIFFSPRLKKENSVMRFIKEQLGFYVLLLIFLILNHWYKGTPGDMADSNVRMRVKLINDGLFLDYAKVTFLTFGKLIPPHFIPYPLLNQVRKFTARFINPIFINTYFFPFLGGMFFAVLSFLLYSLRKKGKHFRILIFFWFWLAAFSLFTALAVPNTKEVLMRAYEWNTMRYHYFAFMGTAVLLAGLLLNFCRRRAFVFSIAFLVVIVNLLFLWKIERGIYVSTFKPEKEFYVQFRKEFPKLPKSVVFYLYPHTAGLNDYLLEWYYLKDSQYPNLAGQPYRVESQVEAVLKKIKDKKMKLEDAVFLDYNKKNSLINKTLEVRNLVLHQKIYSLNFKKTGTKTIQFAAGSFNGPSIELPYDLEVKMGASWSHHFRGKKPDSKLFRALVDYNVEKKKYLDRVRILTSPTMSQRPGEPFLHVVPENLIDGNPTPRSFWIADAVPAWLTVDLQEKEKIFGVIWGSQRSSSRIPATYRILVSDNGSDWREVKKVRNNLESSVIDVFEAPQEGRYVKMVVDTTSMGDFALIDEFEIINADDKKILDFYSKRDNLIKDSFRMFDFVSSEADLNYARKTGLNFYWGKLTWGTDKTNPRENNQYLYFPYLINSRQQKSLLRLKEAEIYAGPGQFLRKHITSLSLDFGKVPFNIDIKSLKLVPRYKL